MLALVPGFLGFLGIGHLYLGRVMRGLLLLLAGWVVLVLGWGLFLLGVSAQAFGSGTAAILILSGLALMACWLALWMWQAVDARRLNQGRREEGG